MRRSPHQLEPGRDDQSTYFTRVNAGKESVGLDLSRAARAARCVLDLARRADVFVENFMPGVVARLGCDYEAVRAVKPDIVYCSISGFGQTGPWRLRPAFAHIINAISGLMYLEQGDEPAPAGLESPGRRRARRQPRRHRHPGRPLATGAHRPRRLPRRLDARGAGRRRQHHLRVRAERRRRSTATRGPACSSTRSAAGTSPSRSPASPQLWPRLLALMGRPELADDPRFATGDVRRRTAASSARVIGEWVVALQDVEEALAVLGEARIPCAPVLRPAELIAEPPPGGARSSSRRCRIPAAAPCASPRARTTSTASPCTRAAPPRTASASTRASVLGDLLGYDAGPHRRACSPPASSRRHQTRRGPRRPGDFSGGVTAMAVTLVLTEDEALELMAFLVTAARTQLDEAAGVRAAALAEPPRRGSPASSPSAPRRRHARCSRARSSSCPMPPSARRSRPLRGRARRRMPRGRRPPGQPLRPRRRQRREQSRPRGDPQPADGARLTDASRRARPARGRARKRRAGPRAPAIDGCIASSPCRIR